MRPVWLLFGLVLALACGPARKPDRPPRKARDSTAISPTESPRQPDVDALRESPPTDAAATELLAPPPESAPRLQVLSPAPEEVVANPVTFEYRTWGPVARVHLYVDEIPIHDAPLPPGEGSLTHGFRGINVVRTLRAEALSDDGTLLAWETRPFVPADGFMPLPAGFNRFVIETLNDSLRFPRDGRYPYCWQDCPGSMGMVHDVYYLEQELWRGEGSCFCTGHTLEVFLDALARWQAFYNLDPTEPLGLLLPEAVRGGDFYQYWQGYGVTNEASSAAALAWADIGYPLPAERWGEALPGDFVNLSRVNGTGHAVIFLSWVREADRIVGLRYYGCNRRGDSHPDPDAPANRRVSGPSFNSARFADAGGKVLREFLFVGRVVDPMIGL